MKIKRINKKYIIFIISFVFVFAFSFLSYSSKASNLKEYIVNVKLEKNGDAKIEINWKQYDDRGTEHFIRLGNLYKTEVKDFKVYKNDKEYTVIDNWDISKSREEKKDKAGIFYDDSTVELCFGIGDYGDNEFKINYTLSNMVYALDDYDMLYFTFINKDMSDEAQKAEVIISCDEGLKKEDCLFWGFGYDGNIDLKDNKIYMTKTGSLSKDEAMTALIRFNKGIFTPLEKIDKNFQYYKDMAFKGSSYEDTSSHKNEDTSSHKKNKSYSSGWVFEIVYYLFLAFIALVIFIMKVIFKIKKGKERYTSDILMNYDYKHEDVYHRLPPLKEAPNALYILKDMGCGSTENILGYFFLKWMMNGLIKGIKKEEGFIFKRETVSMEINYKVPSFSSDDEKELFDIIKLASREDAVLDEKEFTRWIEKLENRKRFKNFLTNLEAHSKQFLLNKGYISYAGERGFLFKKKVYNFTESGKDLKRKLVDFKAYLEDFSLLKERSSFSIDLWREFLLYAQIYDIADKVNEEFKKIYPDFEKDFGITYSDYAFIKNYSSALTNSYNSSMYSSSSGFGGSSSFGGGSGSFGGSSGGGTR